MSFTGLRKAALPVSACPPLQVSSFFFARCSLRKRKGSASNVFWGTDERLVLPWLLACGSTSIQPHHYHNLGKLIVRARFEPGTINSLTHGFQRFYMHFKTFFCLGTCGSNYAPWSFDERIPHECDFQPRHVGFFGCTPTPTPPCGISSHLVLVYGLFYETLPCSDTGSACCL